MFILNFRDIDQPTIIGSTIGRWKSTKHMAKDVCDISQ